MRTGIVGEAIDSLIKEKGLQESIDKRDILIDAVKDEEMVTVYLSRKVENTEFKEVKEDLYYHYNWVLDDVVGNVPLIRHVISDENYLPKWLYFTHEVVCDIIFDEGFGGIVGTELFKVLHNCHLDAILYNGYEELRKGLLNVDQFNLHHDLKVCVTKEKIYVKLSGKETNAYGYSESELNNLLTLLSLVLKSHRSYNKFSAFQQYLMFVNRKLIVELPEDNNSNPIFQGVLRDRIRMMMFVNNKVTPNDWEVELSVWYKDSVTNINNKNIEKMGKSFVRNSWESVILSSLSTHSYQEIKQTIVDEVKESLAKYISETRGNNWATQYDSDYFNITKSSGKQVVKIDFDLSNTSPVRPHFWFNIRYNDEVLFNGLVDLTEESESRILNITKPLRIILSRFELLEDCGLAKTLTRIEDKSISMEVYPYNVGFVEDRRFEYRLHLYYSDNITYQRRRYLETLIGYDIDKLSALYHEVTELMLASKHEGLDTVFKSILAKI